MWVSQDTHSQLGVLASELMRYQVPGPITSRRVISNRQHNAHRIYALAIFTLWYDMYINLIEKRSSLTVTNFIITCPVVAYIKIGALGSF